MTFVVYKLIASLLIFFASLATVVYPIKTQLSSRSLESFEVAEGFASGVFLGVAFFHMLPNAIHLFYQCYSQTNYPFAEMICICAFLLLIFLERLSYLKNTFNPHLAIPYITAFILIIHSLTEGIALGIEKAYAEALIIFIAVFTHKSCDSFALYIVLLRYKPPFRQVVFILFFFSLITPVGIGLGTLVTAFTPSFSNLLLAALFNAFAAGSFLYIATQHHLHLHHEEKQPMLKFICLLMGTLTMGLIAIKV